MGCASRGIRGDPELGRVESGQDRAAGVELLHIQIVQADSRHIAGHLSFDCRKRERIGTHVPRGGGPGRSLHRGLRH